MTDLSPAAQTIRDAVLATYADKIPKDDNLWALERASTVAALRAAADLVVPEAALKDAEGLDERLLMLQRKVTRMQLRDLAAELKANG